MKNKILDLSKLSSERIDLSSAYKTHRFLHSLGSVDTIKIADGIFSLKTADRSIKTDDSEVFLSRLEVYNKGKVSFSKDSILNTGMYFFNEKSNMLAIPVILSQNDDLSVESNLYVLNLRDGAVKKIDGIIANCFFAFICQGSEKVIYNNSDKVLMYDLKKNKSDILVDFDDPNLRIIKITIQGDLLEVIFSKDLIEDFLKQRKVSKVMVNLKEQICN